MFSSLFDVIAVKQSLSLMRYYSPQPVLAFGERVRSAQYWICKRIKGTNLVWRGWYASRREMATNLYRLGVRPEEAALILRNTPEVVRKHYLRLEHVGAKVDAMARLEQAWDACAATVQ